MQLTIPEEEEFTDNLKVIQPLTGIETAKHNPIVRVLDEVQPQVSESLYLASADNEALQRDSSCSSIKLT